MGIRYASTTVSTANTNKNGTGTIAQLLVGAGNGTRIDYIVAKAVGATTEGMLRFYVDVSSTWKLLAELTVSPSESTATGVNWSSQIKMPALYVGPSQKIGVSTENAETFTVTAMCADL